MYIQEVTRPDPSTAGYRQQMICLPVTESKDLPWTIKACLQVVRSTKVQKFLDLARIFLIK